MQTSSCVSKCSNSGKDSYGYCWLGVVGVLRFVLNLLPVVGVLKLSMQLKFSNPQKLKKVDKHVTL